MALSLSLSLLEMPVNPLQYRGSVGIFNNTNFFVQSKVSHFTDLSDYSSNNNNLTIGLLFLPNKIVLVLLLLKLMSVVKGNSSKHVSTFVSRNLLCWLYILLIRLSRDDMN